MKKSHKRGGNPGHGSEHLENDENQDIETQQDPQAEGQGQDLEQGDDEQLEGADDSLQEQGKGQKKGKGIKTTQGEEGGEEGEETEDWDEAEGEGEEGEEEEGEEGEEGTEDVEDFDVEATAKKVMEYIEARAGKVTKASVSKYVAVAVLVVFGFSRSSILGKILVTVAAGVITKYIVDNVLSKEEAEGEEEEQEEGAELETA